MKKGTIEKERKWPFHEKRSFFEQLTYFEERTYLKVSFDVKDVAKECGAFFDFENKKWYIPPYCKKREILLDKYQTIPDPR